jgi:hypothetical protein
MAYVETLMWLRDWGIDEPLLYRVESGQEKSEICQALGICGIIEDSPTYITEFVNADVHNFGVLIDYPYNRSLNHTRIHRVTTLGEALGKAKELNA